MKRIVCALATSAVAVTLMAGTAAAEGVDETWTPPVCDVKEIPEPEYESESLDGFSEAYVEDNGAKYDDECNGGQYPPAPKQVYVPVPVIDYGTSLTAKGKGLCTGIPAVFAVQSSNDWSQRTFSPGQYVADDGTSWYTFSASELAGLYGPVTVYVKQTGECEGSATTTATINKKQAPAPAPAPAPDNGTSRPDGSGGQIPEPTPAAGPVPAAVLSGGVTAPAAPVAAASAGTTAAIPAQATPSLPVTGSTSDGLLQIALVALATGLGMVYVTNRRRQAVAATNR